MMAPTTTSEHDSDQTPSEDKPESPPESPPLSEESSEPVPLNLDTIPIEVKKITINSLPSSL